MKVTLLDDALPHQIRLEWVGGDLAVSCSCLYGDGTFVALATAAVLTAEQALAVWREHAAPLAPVIPLPRRRSGT